MSETTLAVLPPSEYRGEPLCPCCGDDGTGRTFADCTQGYTHREACAIYKFSEDLCARCAAAYAAEGGHEQ